MRGLARVAGLGEEAAETAWDPDRISAPRSVCEGALGTWVHAATNHRHKRGGALTRRGPAGEDLRSARQTVRRRPPGAA